MIEKYFENLKAEKHDLNELNKKHKISKRKS